MYGADYCSNSRLYEEAAFGHTHAYVTYIQMGSQNLLFSLITVNRNTLNLTQHIIHSLKHNGGMVTVPHSGLYLYAQLFAAKPVLHSWYWS